MPRVVALTPVDCQEAFAALGLQMPDEGARRVRACMATGEPVGEREIAVLKTSLLYARDNAAKLSDARHLHSVYRQICAAADDLPFILSER